MLESGKEVLIENNKFGCRSVEQVTEDCLTSTHPEIVNDDSITLFPNPTSRYLQINGIAISDITSIAIYDVLGRQVYRSDSTIDFADDIDVSDLGYGSFIMEVQLVSNRVAYERFVKY